MARDFEAKNIIVGAATFYVGPQGLELSTASVTASGATLQDPTKMNYPSASAWSHLGYTQNGVTMNIEPTYGEVMVDQLLDVARLFKSAQRVTVATSLTEATLENLYVAIAAKKEDFKSTGVSASVWASDYGTGTGVAPTGGNSLNTSSAGTVATELILNGGALGNTPVERSVLFVGAAPAKIIDSVSGATKSERLYFGYRAVSMDAVGQAVQRDNATLFPVNFRMLPSEANPATDGNATYGKIVDRVF
jgi:hypothetical protein